MIQRASEIEKSLKYRFHTSVCAGLSGTCFEIQAEYRYIRTIGADIVGKMTSILIKCA